MDLPFQISYTAEEKINLYNTDKTIEVIEEIKLEIQNTYKNYNQIRASNSLYRNRQKGLKDYSYSITKLQDKTLLKRIENL